MDSDDYEDSQPEETSLYTFLQRRGVDVNLLKEQKVFIIVISLSKSDCICILAQMESFLYIIVQTREELISKVSSTQTFCYAAWSFWQVDQ